MKEKKKRKYNVSQAGPKRARSSKSPTGTQIGEHHLLEGDLEGLDGYATESLKHKLVVECGREQETTVV